MAGGGGGMSGPGRESGKEVSFYRLYLPGRSGLVRIETISRFAAGQRRVGIWARSRRTPGGSALLLHQIGELPPPIPDAAKRLIGEIRTKPDLLGM